MVDEERGRSHKDAEEIAEPLGRKKRKREITGQAVASSQGGPAAEVRAGRHGCWEVTDVSTR